MTYTIIMTLLWLTYFPLGMLGGSGSSLVTGTSDYYKINKVRLVAESSLELRAMSLLACVASCKLDVHCFGVNYDKSVDVCVFLYGNIEHPEGPGTADNQKWISVIMHHERVCSPWPTVFGPQIVCPERYQHFNQKCYGIMKEKKTRDQAAVRCGEDEAGLLSIESIEEQGFICALVCDSPDVYWTSGQFTTPDQGIWLSSGSSLGYTNWKSDVSSTEPNVAGIFIDGRQQSCLWDNDTNPMSKRYFICKYPKSQIP